MRRTALAVILLTCVNVIGAEAMDGYETFHGYAFGKAYSITIRNEAQNRPLGIRPQRTRRCQPEEL